MFAAFCGCGIRQCARLEAFLSHLAVEKTISGKLSLATAKAAETLHEQGLL